MVRFIDDDRLTPFIGVFRPMLAKQLDGHVEQAYKQMVDNWEQGQDATGQPWQPNAPSTIARKGSSTPLIETRQMIDSAGYNVDRSDLSATIYIDDAEDKVLAHEYGRPDLGIPQRPILAPTLQVVNEDADGLMGKAFDRAWSSAAISGTAITTGFKMGGNTGGAVR